MTKFGGLDVVQRARGVPTYGQLAGDAVKSELLGITQDRLDLENLPES